MKDKKFLRVEDVDKDYTLVIKRGWKWKNEKMRDWLNVQIGKEHWETKPIENGEGMIWLIFKDKYVKNYLWIKADRVSEEGIFTLDEVFTAAQRKKGGRRQKKKSRVTQKK